MHAPQVILRPNSPGARVPIPGSRAFLPAKGQAVTLDAYWHRRLSRGEVVLVEDKQPRTKTKE